MLADVDGVPPLWSAESPLTLLVSLRTLPGKFPAGPLVVGVDATDDDPIRGDEKRDWECRGLLSVGDSGPSGPLYMALTTPAAPTNCSLMGRPPRRVLCDLPRVIGIRGAVSGLLCADGCVCAVNCAIEEKGLGLGRGGLLPMTDLARARIDMPCDSGGGGGSSLWTSPLPLPVLGLDSPD